MSECSRNAVAMKRTSVFFLALVVGVAGCQKKEGPGLAQPGEAGAPGVVVGNSNKPLEELAPGDVVVAVNGAALTRQEFEETLDRMSDSYRLANPKVNGYELKNYRNLKQRQLIPEFVTKHMLLAEASRRKLAPSPEHLSQVESMLAKRAKNEGKSVDAYLRSLGPAADKIRQDVTNQALILTLRQAEFGDRLKVTDADLQEARQRVDRYNEMCAATNALVLARGAAIFKRLQAGEDFGKVADETTEEKGTPHGFWGEFSRAEIEDAKVRNAAFTLPVGGISEPLDTDEGLVILKVLERQGLNVETPVAVQTPTAKLGRILLLLGEERTLADDATLKRELEKTRLAELQRDWFATLRANVRIEYPNGTNFWGKADAKKQ